LPAASMRSNTSRAGLPPEEWTSEQTNHSQSCTCIRIDASIPGGHAFRASCTTTARSNWRALHDFSAISLGRPASSCVRYNTFYLWTKMMQCRRCCLLRNLQQSEGHAHAEAHDRPRYISHMAPLSNACHCPQMLLDNARRSCKCPDARGRTNHQQQSSPEWCRSYSPIEVKDYRGGRHACSSQTCTTCAPR
jgi:hypothetical protein